MKVSRSPQPFIFRLSINNSLCFTSQTGHSLLYPYIAYTQLFDQNTKVESRTSIRVARNTEMRVFVNLLNILIIPQWISMCLQDIIKINPMSLVSYCNSNLVLKLVRCNHIFSPCTTYKSIYSKVCSRHGTQKSPVAIVLNGNIIQQT